MKNSVSAARDRSGNVACDFCGRKLPPEMMPEWFCNKATTCCPACAVNNLPKLIADSVDMTESYRWNDHFKNAAQAIDNIERVFWRTIAQRSCDANMKRRFEDE